MDAPLIVGVCPPLEWNEKGGFWKLPPAMDGDVVALAKRLGFKYAKKTDQYWTTDEVLVEELQACFTPPESLSAFPRVLEPTVEDKALDSLLEGRTA
jgi:hypothetical protein